MTRAFHHADCQEIPASRQYPGRTASETALPVARAALESATF